jgi:hypothetical protein
MDILENAETENRTHAKTGERFLRGAFFDWVYLLPCTWLMVGLALDGWAHNHVPKLETFFTPWHGVLYSGYLVAALFLLGVGVYGLRQHRTWQQSLPGGYGLSLVGIAVFALGGVLDLVWHTLFGIERSVEALLSPTHLLLALGGILIIGGPFRVAWQRLPADLGKQAYRLFPMLLSLAYILTTFVFFTQFADPIAHPYAGVADDELIEHLGIVSILFQAALFMGAALLVARRWRLPFGAFTLLNIIPSLMMSVMARQVLLGIVAVFALLTGLLIDLLYRALKPGSARVMELRLFAFVTPVIITGIYFLAFALNAGVAWSVHLWGGTILMAGVVGLLLSYILVPPALSPLSSASNQEDHE